jgi:hypothetical protein
MPKTIKVKYTQDKDYRLIPTQGLWGGPGPTGDIIADIYVERALPPTEVTLEIDPPNAREVSREGESQVRHILMGLVMRPEVAHAMGEWLIAKARAAGFTPPTPAANPAEDGRH